jgi:hypothetical protein
MRILTKWNSIQLNRKNVDENTRVQQQFYQEEERMSAWEDVSLEVIKSEKQKWRKIIKKLK